MYTSPDNMSQQAKKQVPSVVSSKHQQNNNTGSRLAKQTSQQSKMGANGQGRNAVNNLVPKLKIGLGESSDAIVEGATADKEHVGMSDLNKGEEGGNMLEELKALPGGKKYVGGNNDNFIGNSIISKVTRSLGSLKTLSGADVGGQNDNRNFNLFSHHVLQKEGKPLDLSYEALKEGVLELYLSVKIRSDEEIDNYNEEFFKDEKRQLRSVDGFTLIDYIKSSIEVLMNMKVEE